MLCCLYINLPTITNPMQFQQFAEVIPPPVKVDVCKITLPILYCVSYTPVTLLIFNDAPVQVCYVCSYCYFQLHQFQLSDILFVPEMSTSLKSYTVLF